MRRAVFVALLRSLFGPVVTSPKTSFSAQYPASVLAVSLAAGNDQALQQAEREAIPEFMRFNIVESEVWNVI